MADITIEGADELIERLDKLINIEQAMKSVGKACSVVERAAKQEAPKDNGELRRSITSKVEQDGNDAIGIVFTPLEYAPYIYVRSLNRAKSGKPKQLKYQTI